MLLLMIRGNIQVFVLENSDNQMQAEVSGKIVYASMFDQCFIYLVKMSYYRYMFCLTSCNTNFPTYVKSRK